MATIQTRQSKATREGSYSSNRSFDDYDTDEIRRRWQIRPTERARSLTRDEAHEIIERQSSTDSYTGYTYGDSISYRSDGTHDYLHPQLNRRKYVDFGAGGDVTNYQLAGSRIKSSHIPLQTHAWNWVSANFWNWVTVLLLTLFRVLLVVVKGIATFGIFLGSLVYAAQQKISTYVSSHKVRNWWPLLFFALLFFTTALYGVHNKVNNDRDISTALYQDSQVVRQWSKSTVSNAYNSLPSISGGFRFIGDRTKAFFSAIGNFFGDIFKTVTNALYFDFNAVRQWTKSAFSKVYNSLPSISGIFGGIGERVKNFFSDIRDLFVSIYYSTINAFHQVIQTVRHWFSSIGSGIYNLLPSISGIGGRVKSFFSAIGDFFADVYKTVANAIYVDFNAVGRWIKTTTSNVYNSIFGLFGKVGEQVHHVASSARQGIVSSILSVYNFLPNFSEFFYIIGDQAQHVVSVIRQFFVKVYRSTTEWVYKPSVVDHPADPAPTVEKVVERVVIREKEVGLDMSEVERLIMEKISLYDADKTGQPDYALESSGGSVVGIGCTKVYEETSRLQAIFGISLYFSNYGPRTVIQRRANSPTAGECWAYESGHGQLQIQLSHKISVKSVSYEHLSPRLSPEGHMKTAPKDFRVWSIQNHKKSDEHKHLLGEFVYLDDGEALQNFEVQFPDENLTEVIEFETTTNHGSPVTCLYRFRVHGQPPLFSAEPI